MALLLMLSACSSSPRFTYYQLPTTAGGQVSETFSNVNALWVKPVSVADFLAGNSVIYQISDVRYMMAAQHLWGSPLDQQLQQTLISNLNATLPRWMVSASPLGEHYDTLNVNINGFHGRYDGSVIISGEWVLQHHNQLIKRSFFITLKQNQDGYDALIKTLAKGWQQEAQCIADHLLRLNQSLLTPAMF